MRAHGVGHLCEHDHNNRDHNNRDHNNNRAHGVGHLCVPSACSPTCTYPRLIGRTIGDTPPSIRLRPLGSADDVDASMRPSTWRDASPAASKLADTWTHSSTGTERGGVDSSSHPLFPARPAGDFFFSANLGESRRVLSGHLGGWLCRTVSPREVQLARVGVPFVDEQREALVRLRGSY